MPAVGLEPQLVDRTSLVPEADSWIHEIKYDGYRLLASVQPGNIAVSAIWRCLDQETAVDR